MKANVIDIEEFRRDLGILLRMNDKRSEIIKYAFHHEEITLQELVANLKQPTYYSIVHGILHGTGHYSKVGSLLTEEFPVFIKGEHHRFKSVTIFSLTKIAREAVQAFYQKKEEIVI